MSLYSQLSQLPEDPILKIPPLFKADSRPEKVNLGIGAYRDGNGRPVVFEAVRQAEQLLVEKALDKEYPPIGGEKSFCDKAIALVLGEQVWAACRDRLLVLQSVGASGALRIGGEFIARHVASEVAIAAPTWANHRGLFNNAGLQLRDYPYGVDGAGSLAFEEMYAALEARPRHTVVLLQGCCHNPSGCDPTFEQWRALATLCRERELIPFFDLAYQGVGDGFDSDGAGLRHFIAEGIELFAAVSFSKNFGLYGERVGLLVATVRDPASVSIVNSHFKSLIRANYSMPPVHGARIIDTILGDPALRALWREELDTARRRIAGMRRKLTAALDIRQPDRDHRALAQGKGLFAFTGLSPAQVLWVRSERAVYLPEDGRINVAGLNEHNIERAADALVDAAVNFAM